MLRRFLPLALTMTLLCPLTAFAQTPPAAPTPPATTKRPDARFIRIGGRISVADAAAKTITLTHGTDKTTTVVSVPDTAKVYKVDDSKDQPTGTFADLTVGTKVIIMTNGDPTAPIANKIKIRGDGPTQPFAKTTHIPASQ